MARIHSPIPMKIRILSSFGLILWLVLAFALAIPSGWVHLPLAIGCILIARAIVGKR